MARNSGHLSPRISSVPVNEFMLMRQHGVFAKIPWLTTNNIIRFPLSFYTTLPATQEIGEDLLMWRALLPDENVTRSFLRPTQISDERLIEGSRRFAVGMLTGLKSSSQVSPFYVRIWNWTYGALFHMIKEFLQNTEGIFYFKEMTSQGSNTFPNARGTF
ncbi:hypothetical protein AWC38_SpisGene15394 [Stylophora pistillata]|uniref:Uncharacterized protein n=1 Tax=Stylophora pistillata TaxID=50429 RepID=A0A2B4RTL3_STYPI|nr:hypothetical protein AWC38_SpisGene15394 [Stylophora pistillata]